MKAIRITTGRKDLVCRSTEFASRGSQKNKFFWTGDVEPAETAFGLWIRKRREMPEPFRRWSVGLEMISNGLRACYIISKAYNIRNLELVEVPLRYSDCVLKNLNWIEVAALHSVVSEISTGRIPSKRSRTQ